MFGFQLFVFACVVAIFLSCIDGGTSIGIDHEEQYAVVIDAGSTGTRAFVFKLDVEEGNERVISSFSCGKERVGLSSFVGNPSAASDMFTELLNKAAAIVPDHLHSQTSLFVKGTAGMRLLSEADQELLWSVLVHDLQLRSDVRFNIDRKNFGTISGHQEAFYAVLASNYIVGSIDGQLRVVDGNAIIGALDMGGSSNQLIIYNGSDTTARVEGNHFWSHSWLRFGAEMVRERVLNHIYATTHTRISDSTVEEIELQMTSLTNSTHKMYLKNPCGMAGYTEPYRDNYIFIGTGQPEACVRILEHIMWVEGTETGATAAEILQESVDIVETLSGAPFHQCSVGPCAIDNVSHPTVNGHHFYAMSVYYYALDCVRQLGPASLPHWPTPSIAELRVAAEAFCGLSWTTLEELYHVERGHSYTYTSQLPHRCMEALYIVTLLEKGFGFAQDSRAITYALEVGGKEVEWTLGFVLAEVDTKQTETESGEAHIDSSMLGELPHRAHELAPENGRNHADYTAATIVTADMVLETPVVQQKERRAPAISPEDALRYLALVNDVIAKVENTVGELVEQAKNVKAQCQTVLQRFVRF